MDPTILPHQAIPLSRDITTIEIECLSRTATENEIQQAVYQISPLIGPNGMHAIYYQKSWHTDICIMILTFFKHGHLLKELSETHITLIPEKEIPRKV